jgi:hypothetical protein
VIPIKELHEMGFIFEELRDWQLGELIAGKIDIFFFIRSSVAKGLYLTKYEALTMFGGLKKIEDLTRDEKLFYWNQTEGLEKNDRIDLCKILYVIDNTIVKKGL